MPKFPHINNVTIREAFLLDGLSVTDSALNEWAPMQDCVASLIMDAAREAGVYLNEDDVDEVYARADAIVGRIDTAGKV